MSCTLGTGRKMREIKRELRFDWLEEGEGAVTGSQCE